MQFFMDNWQVIFSGFGTALLVALGGWLFGRKAKNKASKVTNKASAGAGSQIIQAGRDTKSRDFETSKSVSK